MKNINDIVVARLNEFMGKQNLTQYKLAQLSNIPFSTIKSIFQKRTRGISLKTIILLSRGLNITPSQFLDSNDFLSENLDLE